jgi:hypothetical protein
MAKREKTRTVRTTRTLSPALRKGKKALRHAASRAQVTLGDLIAAAYDTVGPTVKGISRVLSSPEMSKVTGRKIVFV